MNKCLQCVNMMKKKDQQGRYRIRCSEHPEVMVYGELGAEPIVEDCGTFHQLRVYRKDARK